MEKNNVVPYIPEGCQVHIFGERNLVEIDPSVTHFVANISIGDAHTPIHGCTVRIGKNCTCNGLNMVLYENNSSVCIGEACMFSFGIDIWASDSHSIIDDKTKELLNWGKEIFIGNHVWVGMKVSILKNSYIGDHCIVGANSVVTKKFTEPHCIIAGNPARIVKRSVSWDGVRPVEYQQKFQCGEFSKKTD